MSDNIVLKTYKGGNVTPQNDAIIYETAIPGSGIFRGCEVTYARGNVLHISQGFGMILGRFFEVYETEIDIRLADIDETLNGRVYIHLDLSNTDEPIKILTQTATELPPLDADINLNYNNSSYDLELAVFTVSATGLDRLTRVFPTLKAGNGSGKVLTRSAFYSVGDVVAVDGVPGWVTLVCTQEGTTASLEPSGYAKITKVGDQVLDGTAIFTARDIIGELDILEEHVGKLSEKVGSEGLVLRLISLDEYKALESYDNNTIYLCYIDEQTRRVVRIFVGKDSAYAAGIKVLYHINTDDVAERIVSEMEDAIRFAPRAVMDGYVFVGWRQDNSAEKKVLETYIIDSEESVDLYAVFKKETNISIRLMPNGGTLTVSGAKESFTADYYYNNGNYQSEPVIIPQNPYTRKGMSFCGWSIDSVAPPAYIPGEIKTIKGEGMLYAMWVRAEVEFSYTGDYVEFVIPQNGIYEFEVWGGSGSDATNGNIVAEGGLGGHSKGYKKMQRGDVVYIFPGGAADAIFAGANGGGEGGSDSRNNKYGSGGGGATHIATDSSVLKRTNSDSIRYEGHSTVLIVAGGGGGGAINGTTVNKGGAGGGEQGENGSDGVLGGRQISSSSDPAHNFGHAKTVSLSSEKNYGMAGGGGGWYGGDYGSRGPSGGGGSGYIDGVAPFTYNGKYYPAETEAGVNKGNGRAYIRYIECI